jgi:hypothetical protein
MDDIARASIAPGNATNQSADLRPWPARHDLSAGEVAPIFIARSLLFYLIVDLTHI